MLGVLSFGEDPDLSAKFKNINIFSEEYLQLLFVTEQELQCLLWPLQHISFQYFATSPFVFELDSVLIWDDM